jgi:hypothetical protein
MGSRPAANPRYLKSGELASFFWVVCFLTILVSGFSSLPSGQLAYDHFPSSAKAAA